MSCEAESRIVSIAIVIEPVVVPVPLATVVAIEIEGVAIAVRVAQNCTKHRQFHCPSKSHDDLKAVSDSAS